MILIGIAPVAEDLGVPQHVVRFWTQTFPQVRPIQRARRWYYRSDDVETLRGIQTLLHDRGLTLDGLRRVFRERGIAFVRAVGHGKGAGDPLDALAAGLALAELPPKRRDALIEVLADPESCRALADAIVAQGRTASAATHA